MPLLLIVMALFWSRVLIGAPVIELDVDLSQINTGTLSGRLTIEKWSKTSPKQCLYLPLNEPQYHLDPAQGLSPTLSRYGRISRQPGVIQLAGRGGGHLIEVEEGVRTFHFKTTLPRWEQAKPSLWFVNDFYPIPLDQCPRKNEEPFDYAIDPEMMIRAQLRNPSLRISHPAIKRGNHLEIKARKLSFVAYESAKTQTFEVQGLPVEVISHTPSFSPIIQSVEAFVGQALDLLGPFPFPRLLVVETDDLERSITPGIITVNKEKQRAQSDELSFMNWPLWQLSFFTTSQWFGAARRPTLGKDFWFAQGMSDFYAAKILAREKTAWNFFTAAQGEKPIFDFDYREAQDLMAAVLTFFQPFNALTDEKIETKEDRSDQHPLQYVRHTMAMRFLEFELQEKLIALGKDFLKERGKNPTSARDFYQFLKKRPEMPEPLKKALLTYWTTDSWPDFSLGEVSDEGDQLLVEVTQEEPYLLPIDVEVSFANGQKVTKKGYPKNRLISLRFPLSGEVSSIEINPKRTVFDADRFDNRDGFAKFQFFPGGARSFADDKTTVIWLPLFAKLPGEEFSLLLGVEALRYVQSSYTLLHSYVPSENRFGFQGFFLTDLPDYGLFTIMRVAQDFANTFRGDRVVEAGLYRAPFLIKDPNIEVGLRVRSRQTLGQEDTIHQTLTARLKVVPLNPEPCFYELKADLETTPGKSKSGFQYQRNTGLARFNCKVFDMDLGMRGFVGQLSGEGEIPSSVAFKPQDVSEARVRMDQPKLESVKKIANIGLDALWAAWLPLPESLFFLPKESRFRAFYDYASTQQPTRTFESSGMGLMVPMGGDAVGKQSITLFQFSLLFVMYRKIDGMTDTSPGILVDFLGNL